MIIVAFGKTKAIAIINPHTVPVHSHILPQWSKSHLTVNGFLAEFENSQQAKAIETEKERIQGKAYTYSCIFGLYVTIQCL